MKDYILEQQILKQKPNKREIASSSTTTTARPSSSCCAALGCRHLEALLPHLLNLDCIPANNNNNTTSSSSFSCWTIVNPVHALHLNSLLQPPDMTLLLPKGHLNHTQPCLFGEEQRRTDAVLADGISETYCRLKRSKNSTTTMAHERYVVVDKTGETTSSGIARRQPEQQTAVNTATMTTGNKPNVPLLPAAASRPVGVATMTMTSQNITAGPPPPAPFAASGVVPGYGAPPHRNAAIMGQPTPRTVPSTTASGAFPMPSSLNQGAIIIAPNKTAAPPPQPVPSSSSSSSSPYLLPEDRFQELRRMEELILQQRRTTIVVSRKDLLKMQLLKKRKKQYQNDVYGIPQVLPDSYLTSIFHRTNNNKQQIQILNKQLWEQDALHARGKVEEWMERFRSSRNAYWDCKQEQRKTESSSFFGELKESNDYGSSSTVCCERCAPTNNNATGDELFQCLDCSFVGCGMEEGSRCHIFHHMIETGHSFAVTCGARADVYCFECGDFVFHTVFDCERERIDVCRRLPWMGWDAQPVQRSFDALQFATTSDHGVVWRGLFASYPSLIPEEYLECARSTLYRSCVLQGDVLTSQPSSLTWGAKALDVAVHQQSKGEDCWKISAPVGAYNLGNTCFMSSVINVLVHCVPFQRHFLLESRHHHVSCRHLRRYKARQENTDGTGSASAPMASTQLTATSADDVCLACEMDMVFLDYFGSSIGKDVKAAVCESPNACQLAEPLSSKPEKDMLGEPLIMSDLLTAAWRSGGMNHLAGYDQRDAHEFLQAFLDILGKHSKRYQDLVREMTARAASTNALESTVHPSANSDIVKALFEGTLRSVLICGDCGCKRAQSEPFLNISLPLAKQMEGSPRSSSRLTIQWCLQHFTDPEPLGDPIQCPSCERKTATRKQHTFAKLPRILCIHLKRFDAAKNRKIIDFVSFPEFGLDMGPLMPHWCEVEEAKPSGPATDSHRDSAPTLLYDLFGTVIHVGTMLQGHYTSNVKVDQQWYHCNDAHVSVATSDNVLKCEGAYMLFYKRRF